MTLEQMEYVKRNSELSFIASENFASEKILEACGSIFSMKYAEGFPSTPYSKNTRYYQGCEIVDEMESQCINECLKLFKANDNYTCTVQPNSGSSANMIVYNAVLQPKDVVLACDLQCGSHVSHSSNLSFLAKYHTLITYGLKDDNTIDYETMEEMALTYKPKLIIVGMSNYSRPINFKRVQEIANKIGAYTMADIAHISTLCAHGHCESPVNICDFITFTTHKILKGPRGGCVIYKKCFDKQMRISQIPSLFGGPLENHIYGKLIAFQEANTFEHNQYLKQVLLNASAMTDVFIKNGIKVLTNGTQNHSFCLDLSDYDFSGKDVATILANCGIITNCNSIPHDTKSFLKTSGVRFGTPCVTARGLNQEEVKEIAKAIVNIIYCFIDGTIDDLKGDKYKVELTSLVYNLVEKYPLRNIYPNMYNRLFIESEVK